MRTNSQHSMFKKVLACVLSLAMVASMVTFVTIGASAETVSYWDGVSFTDKDTLLGQSGAINSAADLAGLLKANKATDGWAGCSFTLNCDINLGGYDWAGISSDNAYPFVAAFDFNGHTITGLSTDALTSDAANAARVSADVILAAFNAWIGDGVLASRDSDNWGDPGAADFGTYYDNTPDDACVGFPFFAGIGTPFKAMWDDDNKDNGAIIKVDGDLQIGGSALKGMSLVEIFKKYLGKAVTGTVKVESADITGAYLAGKFAEYIAYIKGNSYFTNGRYSAIKAGTCDILAEYPAAWEAKTVANLDAVAAAATSADKVATAALFGYCTGAITGADIATVAPRTTSTWDGTSATDLATLLAQSVGTDMAIRSAADLAGVKAIVAAGTADFAGWTLNLECDIDLDAYEWSGIGTADHPFKGTFNFSGYSVVGLSELALTNAAVSEINVTAAQLLTAFNAWIGHGVLASRDSDNWGNPEAANFGTYWDKTEADKAVGFPFFAGIGTPFKAMYEAGLTDNTAIIEVDGALQIGGAALKGKSLVDIFKFYLGSAVPGTVKVEASAITGEYLAEKFGEYLAYIRQSDLTSNGRDRILSGACDILAKYPAAWEAGTTAKLAAAATVTEADIKVAALFGYNDGVVNDAVIETRVAKGATSTWDGTSYTSYTELMAKGGQINSAEDLAGLYYGIKDHNDIVDGWAGYNFKLNCNIDLANKAWSAIGTATKNFKGNFDFNGNAITNLNAAAMNTNAVKATRTTAEALVTAYNILMNSSVATSREYDDKVEDVQPYGTYYDENRWDYRWGFTAYSGMCNVFQNINDGYDLEISYNGADLVFGSDGDHQLTGTSVLDLVNGALASVNTAVCRSGVEVLTEVDIDTFVACLQSWIDYCKSDAYNNFRLAGGNQIAVYTAAHNGQLDILVNYPGIWTATTVADLAAAADAPVDTTAPYRAAIFGYTTGTFTDADISLYVEEGPTAKSIFLDKFDGKTLTVTSTEDLANILLYIGDFDTLGWEGYTFILGNDIDLENARWSGLGGDQAFAGTFDFNGHKIVGFNAEDIAEYAVTAEDLIAAYNLLMGSAIATSREYDSNPDDGQPYGTYYDENWWDYRWGFTAYSGLCNVFQKINGGWDLMISVDDNAITFGSDEDHQITGTKSIIDLVNGALANVNTDVCREGVEVLTEVDLEAFVACLQSWIDYCKSDAYNNFRSNGNQIAPYTAAHNGELDILVNYPGIWSATSYNDIVVAASEIADYNLITVPAFLGNFTGSVIGGEVELYMAVEEADGDVNGDGDITTADVIYLLYNTFYPEDYVLDCSGDVNSDGDVTTADVIYLLYYTFYPEDYVLYPEA